MIPGWWETKIPYGVQHGKKKKDYRRRWDYWRKATDNVGEDQVKDTDK